MSQVTRTYSNYEKERNVTKPCPACGGKFVMILQDFGKEISWPRCQTCKFDGAPRYQDTTTFAHDGLSDDEVFSVGYENWDILVDFITDEMEKNPNKTAKQIVESEDDDGKETLAPTQSSFA